MSFLLFSAGLLGFGLGLPLLLGYCGARGLDAWLLRQSGHYAGLMRGRLRAAAACALLPMAAGSAVMALWWPGLDDAWVLAGLAVAWGGLVLFALGLRLLWRVRLLHAAAGRRWQKPALAVLLLMCANLPLAASYAVLAERHMALHAYPAD
ncbi:hypothetical protein [Chitinimonas koreensis]|uniref:hypothetical protein n=1 Tax=Chitinimonas koreensis TaxID=356302 RepID=UPI000407F917|nr:hypothetical protein [Chitinimonas koreensis]QNM97016.1 hypothetical protein H9L41_01335 [Chitinimonas koreensis]